MYDPSLGRFLQPDPIGVDADVNLYRYVLNAPTAYVDPYGEFFAIVLIPSLFTTVPPAVGAIVGAIVGSGVGLYLGNELSQILFSEDAGSGNKTPGKCEKKSKDKQKINEDTDMTDTDTWPEPPTEGPFQEGDPSKKKPKDRGEKSLYDKKGGEWRPHKPDPYHDPHWNYKRPGNNSPWTNVDMDGNVIPKTGE